MRPWGRPATPLSTDRQTISRNASTSPSAMPRPGTPLQAPRPWNGVVRRNGVVRHAPRLRLVQRSGPVVGGCSRLSNGRYYGGVLLAASHGRVRLGAGRPERSDDRQCVADRPATRPPRAVPNQVVGGVGEARNQPATTTQTGGADLARGCVEWRSVRSGAQGGRSSSLYGEATVSIASLVRRLEPSGSMS